MAAIGVWAREIGPWRLGFGLAAIVGAYARIVLSFAGYQGSGEPGWVIALTVLPLGCAIASGWWIMPSPRVARLEGMAHGFLVLLVVNALWSLSSDMFEGLARPKVPHDFFVIIFPVLALVTATQALVRQPPHAGNG